MIKRPESVPGLATAYNRPISGYQSPANCGNPLATSAIHPPNSAYNNCYLSSGQLTGQGAKIPDSIPAVYCKTPPTTSGVANPLDLSLRTIRVTPDSTAVDDHVLYLEQEHKMIPTPTPQSYLPPAGHDRRMADVPANHMHHYGVNGGHFGMMQGNTASPVSYDVFQAPRPASNSQAMSSRFSALHPLTSELLQRNSMFSNPNPPYEQYHHPSGYHNSTPANYQMQPNISRVNCDGITSLYQAPPGGMRGVKHISNMIPESKGMMAPMYPDRQMMKSTSNVSTSIPSAVHPSPLQATLMHDIQSPSFHSAFQKPVCTKECCKPTLPPPCACCWNPKQPMTTYPGHHHHDMNHVHSAASATQNTNCGVHDNHQKSTYKYQQIHRNHEHVPQSVQHNNNNNKHQSHHLEHKNGGSHHNVNNAIANLQNSVQRVNSVYAPPKCRTSEPTNQFTQSVHHSDNRQFVPRQAEHLTATSMNDVQIVGEKTRQPYPMPQQAQIQDRHKPKIYDQQNVSYSKSVAIRSASNPPRERVHAPNPTEFLKEKQFVREESNLGPAPRSNSSAGDYFANVPASTLPNDSNSNGGTIDHMIDSLHRVPTCWRPPVSFPDNSDKAEMPTYGYGEKKGQQNSYSGCDNKFSPYQLQQQTSSFKPIGPPSATSSIDDENRVSSTSDLVQPNVSQSCDKASPSSSVGTPIAKVLESAAPTIAATAPKTKPNVPLSSKQKVSDEESRKRILMIQNTEKQLFASFNFDMWLWARRPGYQPGRKRNLVKNPEDNANLIEPCDKSKFPTNWEADRATFKLKVRIPHALIVFPDGFEIPKKKSDDKIPEVVAQNDSCKESADGKPKVSDTKKVDGSRSTKKGSILNRLVDKYQKRVIRSRQFHLRSRQSREESDSDSSSDSESETPEPVKKPIRVAKVVARVKRCRNKSPEDNGSKKTIVTRRRAEEESVIRRRQRYEDSSSSGASSSESNDESWGVSNSSSCRRKERDSRRLSAGEKRSPRKRSPLGQLASSDGYVAYNKKPKTDNLFSDTSLLGREQRALQRAMMQFNALELTSDGKPIKKSKNKKKKKGTKFEKTFKRQLRNRSVDVPVKKDYEPNVIKRRTRKQNGALRKLSLGRYNKNAAYEEQLSKEAQRLASNRIHKRLRSGAIVRSKSVNAEQDKHKPFKKRQPTDESEENGEDEKSDATVEEDVDYKPYKPANISQTSGKQMVTRSAGLTIQAQWQNQQKKRLFVLRKRRFRSGLDMINFHQRQKRRREMCIKKYGPNHFKKKIEAAKAARPDPDVAVDGPPAELKKLMINKALGETILHRASRLGYSDVVRYCLDSNSNEVNSRDNAGYTPLHECCSKGHVNIANYLLQYGADPNASAAGGIRPIHDAIENNQIEITRLLLSYGADPTINTYSGASPLKLSKSESMSRFLKGFFSDVSGESDAPSQWRFRGTSSIFDPQNWGCNVFENVPVDESDDEEDGILFEISDKPHLPSYRLSQSNSLTEDVETGSYVLLQDVVQDMRTNSDNFLTKHKHIKVVSLSRSQFIERATCSQVFPQHELGSSIANIDRVKSKIIQLIPLDNKIRSILGVECITVL